MAAIPGVELAAFCDVARERTAAAAERFHPQARQVDDVHQMLKNGDLDAVYVAVPPFAHGVELAVVEAGRPLYVEKPVALTMESARRIERAIEERNAPVCVGYHWRYTPASERVKDLLADAVIGLVYGF